MKTRRLPVLKRLIPSVRKRLAVLTWPGDFRIVKRYGALFIVNRRNYVDRELAFYGDFEREQIKLMLDNMRAQGCDLFIDVGANIGLYSVIAARFGTEVIAFEPDPRNAAQLRANLFINGLDGGVSVHELAVSESSGTVGFALHPPTSTGQSRVSPGAHHTISAVALDDILAVNDGRRLFVKIDVEGHELAVIAGMRRLLMANRCFLQVESLAPNEERLLAALSLAGYRRLRSIGYDHFFAKF